MTTPDPGESVYLGSLFANLHFFGVVSDLDTPAMMSCSMEASGNDGTVTMDALVGAQGVPGEPCPIVRMEYGSAIDNADDLPIDLLNSDLDIGRTWWIGNNVYIWSGEGWMIRQMGTPGPPGPVPHITPSFELVDTANEIVTSGTDLSPGWLLKINKEEIRGPAGEGGPIRGAGDYDDTHAPTLNDIIAWNGSHYAPKALDVVHPHVYSVPEAAFTSFTAITSRQQIVSFAIPPQPFDWKPIVWGQVRVVGVELDADPLIIGCEVRLGNVSSGTLIGRGFGNITTWTTIIPHFSTPSSANDAITPENSTAVVPAYHSGSEGTIFAAVFNDGSVGAYNFSKTNAQLVVIVMPVSGYQDA